MPGSGTELLPPDPGSVCTGHMPGMYLHDFPAWAAGAPMARIAAANKLNVILFTVPPTYI